MKITAIIDKIGDNLERLKTLAILIVGVFFILSLFQNGCSRSETEKLVERLTGLNIENDILMNDVKTRDSLLILKNDSIEVLKNQIHLSDAIVRTLHDENKRIRNQFNNISDQLLQTTANESYQFLDSIAYPFQGEKKYPFNEPQVKGIHKTFLENQNLLALNDNLQQQKKELVNKISLQDEIMHETTSAMALMSESKQDLEKVVENKDEEIALKEKENKKRKRNNILKTAGVAIVALLVGFVAG